MRRNLCQRLLPFFSHLREVLFLACIGNSIISSATYAETMNFESYHDSAGEVRQLSSEDNAPFLFFGQKVTGSPLEKKYAESLARFPSVLDCLASPNRDKPDLTNFDWSKINSLHDADVCLFRVASSYSTPDEMKRWLKLQGFDTQESDALPSEKIGIRAYWSIRDKGVKFSGGKLEAFWHSIIASGLSVGIDYDVGGIVFTTKVTLITE